MAQSPFAFLQKIGKSLMLPVAVLPVAGLLLGIGAAEFSWMPTILSLLMKNSGDVIFANLPLIFAIGVALGFTENDGVSAIAAAIGYMVMLATKGVKAGVWGVDPAELPGPGIPAAEMLTALGTDHGVRCLWVNGSNVVIGAPDTDAVERRRAESQRLLDAVLDAFPSRAGAARHGVGVVGDGRGS